MSYAWKNHIEWWNNLIRSHSMQFRGGVHRKPTPEATVWGYEARMCEERDQIKIGVLSEWLRVFNGVIGGTTQLGRDGTLREIQNDPNKDKIKFAGQPDLQWDRESSSVGAGNGQSMWDSAAFSAVFWKQRSVMAMTEAQSRCEHRKLSQAGMTQRPPGGTDKSHLGWSIKNI